MSGEFFLRRALDVAVSLALLAVLAPLGVLLAAAVKLTSPGPALYAGERVGKAGRPFRMFKFRTMYSGADAAGPAVTGRRDVRVTPVGRLLRKSKLDELPQLLNVLRGEMSLVGPRPEAPRYVALYSARQREVLAVRPGITGPTQLAFRHEEELLHAGDYERQYVEDLMPRKLELDLAYVRQRTLRSDLRLLGSTVARVVAG